MNEEERLISYNYNELGQEFGDLIVDIRNERDKYKEVLDKIDKLINTDYGWVSYYYKYNNRYLKSEIKEDINKLLEEIE